MVIPKKILTLKCRGSQPWKQMETIMLVGLEMSISCPQYKKRYSSELLIYQLMWEKMSLTA